MPQIAHFKSGQKRLENNFLGSFSFLESSLIFRGSCGRSENRSENLKPTTMAKFNQVRLVQIRETTQGHSDKLGLQYLPRQGTAV